MANTNYPLGHRQNPYSWSVYVEMSTVLNNWIGGWVNRTGSPSYYSQNSDVYNGKGKKSLPYPYSIYTEMCTNGIWEGGWVQHETDGLVYILPSGLTVSENSGTLGSTYNPCSYQVFENMCNNGLWEGGMVGSLGNCTYIPNQEVNTGSTGCGSGCGCGSGSGSGSGAGSGSGSDSGSGTNGNPESRVSAGSAIGSTFLNGEGQITFEWTEGLTDGGTGLSQIRLEVHFLNSNYHLTSINAGGVWSAPFTICAYGTINFTIGEGGVECTTYLNSIEVSVPPENRIGGI